MPLEDLTAQRDALLAARYRGPRTVEIDGRRGTYDTDVGSVAAISGATQPIELLELMAGCGTRVAPIRSAGPTTNVKCCYFG
jgi:hypothetical protein